MATNLQRAKVQLLEMLTDAYRQKAAAEETITQINGALILLGELQTANDPGEPSTPDNDTTTGEDDTSPVSQGV